MDDLSGLCSENSAALGGLCSIALKEAAGNSACLLIGRVTCTSADGVGVRLVGERSDRPASLAVSSLLQPMVNDEVLLAVLGAEFWIVSILSRHAPGLAAQIAVPGASALTVSAPALTLQTESTLKLSSSELDVHAEAVAAHFGVLRLTVRVLQAAAGRLQLWANLLQTRARSLSLRAEQRVTKIDQADLLQAGQVLTEGEQLVQLRARQIQVQAKENVMVDGKQIFMG